MHCWRRAWAVVKGCCSHLLRSRGRQRQPPCVSLSEVIQDPSARCPRCAVRVCFSLSPYGHVRIFLLDPCHRRQVGNHPFPAVVGNHLSLWVRDPCVRHSYRFLDANLHARRRPHYNYPGPRCQAKAGRRASVERTRLMRAAACQRCRMERATSVSGCFSVRSSKSSLTSRWLVGCEFVVCLWVS
jgi:hypothetical protein